MSTQEIAALPIHETASSPALSRSSSTTAFATEDDDDNQDLLQPMRGKIKRTLPLCSVDELRQRIKQGEYLVIIDGLVCRLNRFVKHHPGGPQAILHMVGRDATDEVHSMHSKDIVLERVPKWAVARFDPGIADRGQVSFVEDMDLPYSAPRSKVDSKSSDPGTSPQDGSQKMLNYAAIQQDYRALDQRLHSEGFHQCRYQDYLWEVIRYILLFVTACGLILWGPDNICTYVAAGLCTALLWQQLAFFVHDLGHNELTGRREVDMVLGICVADVLGGLSVGWWKKNHNIHHIVTNDIDNDPDIQHLPFFAISTRFFESRYSTYYRRVMSFDAFARLFVSFQHYLYYVIMCFARYNLYVLSWRYLLESDFAPYRGLEAGCIAVFITWFSWLISHIPSWPMIALYLGISNAVSAVLHVQITLSHFAMSTESPDPENECFAARQIRTTMDVACSPWFDWFHGGLQFQVEHHLFPRLPRHCLRRVQPLVKELCQKHGMDFKELSFWDGNVYTLGWLENVASRARLYNCREHQHTQAMAAVKRALSPAS